MKYFSTFSGIGGFELGIKQAYELLHCRSPRSQKQKTKTNNNLSDFARTNSRESPACVGFSEIDKYATEVYQRHFPEHKNYGDITKINAKELPDFDCLVGGFPCQTFSIAGKRAGFEDVRGTMFFELARILRAKKPRFFVFENVKGLLSHDEGRTFLTIITTLNELGYDCQWQLLNSKNHGVPQNRERVFIIGHIRGTCRPEVFPFGKSASDIKETNKKDTGVCTPPVTTQGGKNCRGMFIEKLNQPRHSNDRVYGINGLSPTLNTMQGGNRQPFVALKEVKIRRLTPVECERLQGFPDNWTAGHSDTQRYKMAGNAVTVNVIKDIFIEILK